MKTLSISVLLAYVVLLSVPQAMAQETPPAQAPLFDRNQMHEFTDEEDRSMRAQIRSVSLHEISIRREDGRNFRVPIETFTGDDRKFVERWRLAEILNSDRFQIDVRRFTGQTEQLSTEIAEVNTAQMGYLITLRNRSPVELRDLTIESKVFKNMGIVAFANEDGHKIAKTGSEIVGILAPGKSIELRSPSLTIAKSELQADVAYLDGSKSRKSDSMEGIWIRVLKDGQILTQFSRPSRILEEDEW